MSVPSNFSKENTQANRTYHDFIAGRYERDPRVRLGTMHPNSARRLDWLKSRYNISENGSIVLNLGVGTGNLMKKSEEIFGFSIGMDISINMLKLAKRFSGRLVQGNALEIPLKAGSVNLIFSLALLHHIYDLEEFFKSIYRVLKPGGIFYSDYDPNRRFFQTIEKIPFLPLLLTIYKKISDQFIFTKQDEKTWRAIHDVAEYHEEFARGLDPSGVARIAEKAGFSQVKWYCHGDSPDLDFPRRGRGIYRMLDVLLFPFSRDYDGRTKIFSMIAVK